MTGQIFHCLCLFLQRLYPMSPFYFHPFSVDLSAFFILQSFTPAFAPRGHAWGLQKQYA